MSWTKIDPQDPSTLPEYWQNCWVCTDTRSIFVASFLNALIWAEDPTITHWMPCEKPQPPSEEGE